MLRSACGAPRGEQAQGGAHTRSRELRAIQTEPGTDHPDRGARRCDCYQGCPATSPATLPAGAGAGAPCGKMGIYINALLNSLRLSGFFFLTFPVEGNTPHSLH